MFVSSASTCWATGNSCTWARGQDSDVLPGSSLFQSEHGAQRHVPSRMSERDKLEGLARVLGEGRVESSNQSPLASLVLTAVSYADPWVPWLSDGLRKNVGNPVIATQTCSPYNGFPRVAPNLPFPWSGVPIFPFVVVLNLMLLRYHGMRMIFSSHRLLGGGFTKTALNAARVGDMD